MATGRACSIIICRATSVAARATLARIDRLRCRGFRVSFVGMTAAGAAASGGGLSTAGRVFFGSLCAGTFGLGCWQTSRLLEKQQLIAERDAELRKDPTSQIVPGTFRRVQVAGVYDHSREMLVGPRGAPQSSGAVKGGGTTVAGTSQQGYYVVTPLVVQGEASETSQPRVILVNRGWVPRAAVHPPPARPANRNNSQDVQRLASEQEKLLRKWARPQGITSVLAVPSPVEKPRFLVAQHNFQERPIQLYWFDLATMRDLIVHPDAPLVTAVAQGGGDEYAGGNGCSPSAIVPLLRPTLEAVVDFKVSPAIHAAYAVTWFGLSAAGLVMTRKLIRARPPPST